MKGWGAAVAAACLVGGSGLAAPSARVTVDKKGALRIPKATWKALQAKPASNGMVCLEFVLPPSPPPKPPPGDPHGGHSHPEPVGPPKFWVPVSREGTAVFTRTRLGPGQGFVPGPPGTVYLATGKKGHVLLKKL